MSTVDRKLLNYSTGEELYPYSLVLLRMEIVCKSEKFSDRHPVSKRIWDTGDAKFVKER